MLLFVAVTIATEGRTVHKKLPDTITVVKLKGMIQRLCGIDYTKQSLSYISREVSVCACVLIIYIYVLIYLGRNVN